MIDPFFIVIAPVNMFSEKFVLLSCDSRMPALISVAFIEPVLIIDALIYKWLFDKYTPSFCELFVSLLNTACWFKLVS